MSQEAADQSGHDDEYVTPRVLQLELKAFRLEVRLLLVVGLIASNVSLPHAITVGSVLTVLGWTTLKSLFAR